MLIERLRAAYIKEDLKLRTSPSSLRNQKNKPSPNQAEGNSYEIRNKREGEKKSMKRKVSCLKIPVKLKNL